MLLTVHDLNCVQFTQRYPWRGVPRYFRASAPTELLVADKGENSHAIRSPDLQLLTVSGACHRIYIPRCACCPSFSDESGAAPFAYTGAAAGEQAVWSSAFRWLQGGVPPTRAPEESPEELLHTIASSSNEVARLGAVSQAFLCYSRQDTHCIYLTCLTGRAGCKCHGNSGAGVFAGRTCRHRKQPSRRGGDSHRHAPPDA